MKDPELVSAIHRLKVETGSLACMGCGHEHNCGVSGCAVMREAADRIANQITHVAALQQEIEKLRGQNEQLREAAALMTKESAELLERRWIPVEERLPEVKMLEVCPMTLREANAYVEQYHRHHGPVVGHKFSIGLSDGEKIVGVAIVGRPVSRHLDDGWTLEVNRLCTDGTRNACSMLYAAAWRAARAMGYKRLVTYILDTENGASLRAAGWKCIGQAGGLRWTGKRRPEVDLCPAQMKIRFERTKGM